MTSAAFRRFVFTAALVFALSPGSSFAADAKKKEAPPATGKTATATEAQVAQCKSLCEARDNVSCPHSPKVDVCVSRCTTFATEAGRCQAQFDKLLEYLSKATWKCADDGYPHVDGSATGVNHELWTCECAQKPQTQAKCGVSSGEEYCDSCISFECPVQSEDCGANPECKEIESCISKCPNDNGHPEQIHACLEKCTGKHAAGAEQFKAISQCMSKGCGEQCRSGAHVLWDTANGANATYVSLPQCTMITP